MCSNRFRSIDIHKMLSIARISDREYQRRVWIQSDLPKINGFRMTLRHARYFVESILESSNLYKLTDEEILIFQKFLNKINLFSGSMCSLEDLNIPEWTHITEDAVKILKLLNYSDRDTFEYEPNLSPQGKQQALVHFLYNISLITDENYQQHIWLQKEDTQLSSYEDVRSNFFAKVYGFLKYANEFGITEIQTKKLDTFRSLFENFGDKFGIYADQAAGFIDKPEWKHVMEKARELLDAFHFSTSRDPNRFVDSKSSLRRYLNVMLSDIEGIADREYQKRVWIYGSGPEVDDFVDSRGAACTSIASVLHRKNIFNLSNQEIVALEKLYNDLDDFSGLIFDLKDLTIPEWVDITEEAAKVLKIFKYLGRDKFKHVPNLSDAEKKEWLENFLQNIALIGDENYQQRIWIQKENPEESNYEDVCRDFFSEAFGILKYANEFKLTEIQINKLTEFRALLNNFEKQFGDRANKAPGFIDKPEWKHVMEKARELLEVFHYSIPNGTNGLSSL